MKILFSTILVHVNDASSGERGSCVERSITFLGPFGVLECVSLGVLGGVAMVEQPLIEAGPFRVFVCEQDLSCQPSSCVHRRSRRTRGPVVVLKDGDS
jgi:hypothetical protein